MEGRRKRVACEKETVSGRQRQRHCGDERDAGFVMAGDLQAFFFLYHMSTHTHVNTYALSER